MSRPGFSSLVSNYFNQAREYARENIPKVADATSRLADDAKQGIASLVNNISSLASGELLPEEIGMFYIVPKVIAMGFPGSDQTFVGVPIDLMSKFLNQKHAGHFMIINLSDRSYDYSLFGDQVIEFKFPGYPSPPLDKIFNICRSMDSWLRADVQNVIAVHCQTGRGRTMTMISCYLAWARIFPTARAALEHISKIRRNPIEKLLVPTQLRYIDYFDRLLSQKFPSPHPIRIERIIVNTIPNFASSNSSVQGCRPCLQIFKHSKLLYSSYGKSDSAKWYNTDDGSILFPVGLELEGDVLLRVRHLESERSRSTMFRIGFHTGFLSEHVFRFEQSEIDGVQRSSQFSPDFFVDLIAESSDSSAPSDASSSAFWESLLHRDSSSSENAKTEGPGGQFVLFDQDDKSNDPEFEDLERYMQGLEGLHLDGDDQDEILMERLQTELGSADQLPDSPTDAADLEIGDLEDEIQAILSQSQLPH